MPPFPCLSCSPDFSDFRFVEIATSVLDVRFEKLHDGRCCFLFAHDSSSDRIGYYIFMHAVIVIRVELPRRTVVKFVNQLREIEGIDLAAMPSGELFLDTFKLASELPFVGKRGKLPKLSLFGFG